MEKDTQKISVIFEHALSCGTLRKIVFSQNTSDDGYTKTEAKLFKQDGKINMQFASYAADGKVFHLNVPLSAATEALMEHAANYGRCNILTAQGEAQYMRSKKGVLTVIDKINDSPDAGTYCENIADHNRVKDYAFKSGEYIPFLHMLDIQDEKGRVLDRRAEKFKQINNFIKVVETACSNLPADRELIITDLCCGKSYLTFAVYYYFTYILGRAVKMTGLDLKRDVIENCSEIAEKLGYTNMTFLYGDVNLYSAPKPPDLVISLHACDTATDLVLQKAVEWGTQVILAAPCCQHALYGKMKKSEPLAISSYPLLKMRYAAILTDALRGKYLETENYKVDMLEFCDPEDTPKNLLIRAVKKSKPLPDARKRALLDEYQQAHKSVVKE